MRTHILLLLFQTKSQSKMKIQLKNNVAIEYKDLQVRI